MTLTAEGLRHLLEYDPETGVFTWRVARGGKHVGHIAGCKKMDGYIYVKIDSKLYLAHRLAWLYVNGTWPPMEIDHINGVRSDNRISNLRSASRAQNARNLSLSKTSKSGVKGVCWHVGTGKWQARISSNRHLKHLGFFSDIVEAKAAYEKAAADLHGEFMRK